MTRTGWLKTFLDRYPILATVWFRYLIAIGFPALALLLRFALTPLTGEGAPFVFLFGAVMASSYFGGLGPGILSSVLGAVSGIVFFIPAGEIHHDIAKGSLFFVEGVVLTWLMNRFAESKVQVERKTEELLESEDTLSLVTSHIPSFVAFLDLEMRYQFVNPTYERFLGIKRADILGKTVTEVLGREVGELAELGRKKALSGQPSRIETAVTNSRGEILDLAVEFVPAIDRRTKKVRGLIVVSHDVTETRRTTRALEEAVRVRDEFMSIASHELKTPLTSLQLQTQLTRKNIEKDPRNAFLPSRILKHLTQTEKSIHRLTRLVDDMLDISRIATGKLSFHPELFDLCELAQEVVERMQPQAETAGTRIRISTCGRAGGNWDRFRIEQVILNLLTNAIRYGAGSPIELRVENLGSTAVLSVRDEGPGIPEENQARVFQRFERGTPGNAMTGLGLGLFICKEIVERHGGTIRLKSAPGQGTTFTVQLPITEAVQMPTRDSPREEAPRPPEQQL